MQGGRGAGGTLTPSSACSARSTRKIRSTKKNETPSCMKVDVRFRSARSPTERGAPPAVSSGAKSRAGAGRGRAGAPPPPRPPPARSERLASEGGGQGQRPHRAKGDAPGDGRG